VILAEKRSFYRVHLNEDRRVDIKLEILTEGEETSRVRSREKGVITTIGGNGLGFYLPEGRSLLLNTDTRLQLKLKLQPEDEELRLLAKVRVRLRRPKARVIFFGVQFIDIDSDIRYKQSVDRILRFVAEEQRRHLAQRRHLNQ
jgi:c-di-GMP-binding flagellar brake protein YcgR